MTHTRVYAFRYTHDVLQCNFSATTSDLAILHRRRQDLMTLQRKLANNGDGASLWEESEMLLLSLGHSFIAQHAKLPMLCQKQRHFAQQELN